MSKVNAAKSERREREYFVIEPVVAENVFSVRARTGAEAIEKVENGEYTYVEQSYVRPDPRRRMFARLARVTR